MQVAVDIGSKVLSKGYPHPEDHDKPIIDLEISVNYTLETIFLKLLCFLPSENGPAIQNKLKEMTGQRTVPNVFIKGKHIGGADDTIKLHSEGNLIGMLIPPSQNYDYDVIVIGGGSGGLSFAKVSTIFTFHVFQQSLPSSKEKENLEQQTLT